MRARVYFNVLVSFWVFRQTHVLENMSAGVKALQLRVELVPLFKETSVSLVLS